MADVQTFLGVDNYLSEDKFVINDETGYYCFKKSREADIVCLPEEKVQTMSGSKKIMINFRHAQKARGSLRPR